MAKFKVGDLVEVVVGSGENSNCGSYFGRVGVITEVDGSEIPYRIKFSDVEHDYAWAKPIHIKLVNIKVNNKTIMSSIKSFIKSVTRTEPEKSFVKAGFIDENENLTEKGREALEFVLWDANKDAVKAIADQVIAAEEVK